MPDRAPLLLSSKALPLALGGLALAGLALSNTSLVLYSEAPTIYPYRLETIARHKLLSTSPDQVVAVPEHRWKPSILFSADVMVNMECIAGYFGKSRIEATEPGS
jgi:hypothetical protein